MTSGVEERVARDPGSRAAGERRTTGLYVIAWIETHCVHTKGKWAGKPFRLLRWQKRFLMALFEVVPAGVDGAGVVQWQRRVQRALLGVAKKNGKTEMAAALALYFAIGDGEPTPIVVCAAAAEDQADLVFGAVKVMAEKSPTLALICDVYDDRVLIPSNGGVIRRLACGGGTLDGESIHAAILDELHEWTKAKHEDTYRVLTKAGGAREQPIVLQITTAGADEESICGQQYQHLRDWESGAVEDPTFYGEWYELPDGADYRDESLWPLANPSLGQTVFPQYLRSQLGQAPENEWRRYFGNQWVPVLIGLFHDEQLDPLADDAGGLDPSRPVHVGIDVGLYHDSTAVRVAQRTPDGRVVTHGRSWQNPYDPRHSLYHTWKLPIEEVLDYLRRLRRDFPKPAAEVDGKLAPGPAFYFDPAWFDHPAEVLAGEGLNMVKYAQTDSRMVPASMGYWKLIEDHVVSWASDDRVIRRHLKACIAEPKPHEKWRLSKPKGTRRKIDAAIADCIAAYEAARQPAPRRRSVYEDRGVVAA